MLLPNSSTVRQSIYQENFSKLQRPLRSLRCPTCLLTFAPPWLDYGRRRHLITGSTLPTCLWTCRAVHLYLFATTHIVHLYSALTMDPTEYSSELLSISSSISMASRTWCRLIASSLPFWMPILVYMKDRKFNLLGGYRRHPLRHRLLVTLHRSHSVLWEEAEQDVCSNVQPSYSLPWLVPLGEPCSG